MIPFLCRVQSKDKTHVSVFLVTEQEKVYDDVPGKFIGEDDTIRFATDCSHGKEATRLWVVGTNQELPLNLVYNHIPLLSYMFEGREYSTSDLWCYSEQILDIVVFEEF